MLPPINFNAWIEENRHLLKPPVGNKAVYRGTDDFIVMVVGGPNARKDFHYNESEELFYQVEGDITVATMQDGKQVDIPVRQGEMFLLPARVPHSPRRPAGSVGLVIEKVRDDDDTDGLMWFCENCGAKLYDEYFHLDDIETQLPPVMDRFFNSEEHRTCDECGHVMAPRETA
ncbi:MAG: 3-hydroxyanthranilate 3,4-dioxygenase [Rhodothermales bacterium]|nr:3-hydroxyanthranilate 3,4-dioxygenase [Rhodothermales bacterium]